MLFSVIILVIVFIVSYLSSYHFLNFLLMMEFFILVLILMMNWMTLNWHFLYFFLIFAVCMSCYGISLLVNNTQNKNNPYFMIF